MAVRSPTQLALKINALLDGQKFLDHWREKFRNPQPYGTSIKSLCPFHLGEGFRSFLLDLRRKTFRCTLTQCKAAAGGTFVDLHGLLTDKPPLDAVLDVCSTFELALPEDALGLFVASLAEHARQLLAEGKIEEAESAAVLAFKKNPTSPVLQLLLAKICEARGRGTDARPYYETALQEAVAEKNWAQASAVLDRLRSLQPDQSAYTEQAAAIAEAQGDRAKAAACYLDLASRPGLASERQRYWLEKARALDPSRLEMLERLAILSEESGQTEQAAGIWKCLAESYARAGQVQQSQAALDRMARLQPEIGDLDEQRADLFLAANCPDQAAQLLKTLATRALEEGAADRAERHLRRLCDVCPNDIESHWLLMTLFEQTDRQDNAALIADHLLAISDAETMGERYLELLKRLRRWQPNNVLYCERLAAYCAGRGDVETALSEMRELAERAFQRGAQTEALQRIQTMLSLVADQPRRRLEIIRILAAHNCIQEALGEYEAIARQLLVADPAVAKEASRRGLELDAARPAFHEVLLQVSLPDHPDEALEQCRWLVEFHRTRGDTHKAVALLEPLRERMPQAVEPRLLLAAFLAEAKEADRVASVLGEALALDLTAEQTARALEIVNALVSQCGPSVELLKLQVSLYRRRGDQKALAEMLPRLAVAQQDVGFWADAETTYSEFLGIRPNDMRALQGRAEVVRRQRGFAAAKPHFLPYLEQLSANSQDEEALRLWQQCTEWAPADADIRRGFGALLAKRGDREPARVQLEMAAALYLADRNDPEAAAKCYETVLSQYPGDPAVARKLACVCVVLDKTDTTARTLVQATEPIPDSSFATAELLLQANLTLNRSAEAFQHANALCGFYVEQGQSEKALALARQMIEIRPQDPAAYECLSKILEKQGAVSELCRLLETLADFQARAGNTQKAAEILARYLAIRPDDIAVRKRHVELVAKAGQEGRVSEECETLIAAALEAGDHDEAKRLFEQALKADPDNLNLQERWARFLYEHERDEEGNQALILLTDRLYQSGEAKRAIALLSEIVQEHPRAAELHARLGDFLLAINAKGRAVLSLKKAAELFAERRQLEAAHALAEKILAIDPQDVTSRSGVVEWLFAAGRTAEAIEHSRILAAQYAERNLLDLAEHEYRRLVLRDPTDMVSWQKVLEIVERLGTQREHVADCLLVAEMLTQRGLLEEAVQTYRRAIQWDSENFEARRALIETHLQIGDEREVIPDYLELAELQSSRGDVEEAVKIYERVLLLEPKNPMAMYHVNRLKPALSHQTMVGGMTLSRLARPATPGDEKPLREGVENYRKMLQVKPDNAMVRSRMGDLLFQLGETQEALKEWDQASVQLFEICDYKPVIRLCEKILQIDPKRTRIQERLSQAKLRKASMTEIESVIESLEKMT